MSILWGITKEPGATVRDAELLDLAIHTKLYATGEPAVLTHGRVGLGLQLYRSHSRSAMDSRPVCDGQGNILCFDGRLDNFRELLELLRLESARIPDSLIALTAFEQWGENCFFRLTGDWAIALWCDREQKLFLARDHAGTRSLYFMRGEGQIRWATYLDLLTASQPGLELSRAYAAAYLTFSPVRDLTPYNHIRAVKPGHYVVFHRGRVTQKAHWNPLVRTSIRYKADADYDEHFLSVFGTAIARRTAAGEPVLAQLSGGMDSTSIVCMSDHMRRRADPHAEILETISFFDDSETSLDERRYFTITEQQRGKAGTHLEIVSSCRTFELSTESGIYPTPGRDDYSLTIERELYKIIWEQGYRSILSGIGGDEVLGGVPDGRPELADHLVRGRIDALMRRAVAWSLPDRSPLIRTLSNTTQYTVGLYLRNNPKRRPIPAWLSKNLRKSFVELERTIEVVPNRLGVAPHRLENAVTWWHIMETLPHLSPQILFRPEYRYPMLDKDLVEFLFSVPPEQLVQPGRRRAMMRRALRGIVPNEILERRRKAFQLRAPLNAIQAAQEKLQRLISTSIIADMGFIEVDALRSALKATAAGRAQGYHAILRVIAYELWLRTQLHRSVHPDSPLVRPHLATP
jgi:asparagine synthase (glutamine-hydrolysing)